MRRAFALVLVACGSSDAAPKDAVSLCTTTLPPKAVLPPPLPPAPLPAVTRPSRIVVDAEVALGPVLKQLESQVPARLAEERGQSIGLAGRLNYVVDRGPFTAAVENDALVVRTDIRARAEACKGRGCYASCAPEGRATARVPLRLGADYRFAPSRVEFAFTRGCDVKVGFLRIDVTPTLASEVQPALRRVEKHIDASLPAVKPKAEKLWAELAKPRPTPLGGCATVNARGLAQGPIAGSAEALRARIGVVAYPEITTQPCPAAAATLLPPLAQDSSMPAEDDVLLALVSPLAAAAHALEAPPFTRVSAVQSGAQAQVEVTVHGAACGEAAALANVAWTDRLALHLDAPEVLRASTFLPAIDPNALPAAAAALAGGDVAARISSVAPSGAGLRNGDVVAWVLLRGSLTVKDR